MRWGVMVASLSSGSTRLHLEVLLSNSTATLERLSLLVILPGEYQVDLRRDRDR
jgi:hypothetical protein